MRHAATSVQYLAGCPGLLATVGLGCLVITGWVSRESPQVVADAGSGGLKVCTEMANAESVWEDTDSICYTRSDIQSSEILGHSHFSSRIKYYFRLRLRHIIRLML